MTRGSGTDNVSRYLRPYLRRAPLAVALWRTAEAAAIDGAHLPRPLLDLGCGFGEFAGIFFPAGAGPDAGLDLDRGEVRRAAAAGVFGSVVQADARRLPFADGSLGGVISVSTLEHIPGADRVLLELARVLRPGGAFVYSVPVDSFGQNLLGYRLLTAAGLRRPARSYSESVNRALTHVNVWPAERWLAMTRDAGLEVAETQRALSPLATVAWEFLLPLALASRLWRRLFGRRPPHPQPVVALGERLFRPLLGAPGPRGSNLVVVGRKPG